MFILLLAIFLFIALVALTGSAYGYVGGNPLNFADPTGMNKCEVGANPLRWVGNATDCVSKSDYVSIDLPLVPPLLGTPFGVGGDINLTITRDGTVYLGGGPAAGTAGSAPSVRFGCMNDSGATNCEIDTFSQGWAATGSAQLGLSVGETYGFGGTATEVGVGAPGARTSLTYSWEVLELPNWLSWG